MQPVSYRIHPFTLLLLFFGLVYIIVTRHATSTLTQAALRQPMPAIAVLDASGTTISSDTMTGRPVIYVLWASWCPPCRAELPVLQALAPQLSEAGIRLVLVNQGEDAQEVIPWLAARHITMPAWFDAQSAFATALQAHDLPSMVFVNGDGNVDFIYRGPVTHDIIKTMQSTWESQAGTR